MSKYKAIIDFSGYTAGDLGPAAQNIHDKMVLNAATFPKPDVVMTDFQTEIGLFNSALGKKASRAIDDQIAFDLLRHDLEGMLGILGNYVNGIAQGNLSIIDQSGFPFYDTAHVAPDTTPPAAPTNVVLRHGTLSGSVVVRYHPGRQRSLNEVQTCTGDPNVEANWQHAGLFSGGKATVAGLTPATAMWFRVRTAGLKGVMGAWSDPARIIVV